METVSTVYEALSQAETSDTTLCVLTLDFREAFDRISHRHLFTTLENYGISPWFIERIKDLYENATASVEINGNLAGPIPIKCAVRQSCPLSM
jgi:RNA-binding protein YlmH